MQRKNLSIFRWENFSIIFYFVGTMLIEIVDAAGETFLENSVGTTEDFRDLIAGGKRGPGLGGGE